MNTNNLLIGILLVVLTILYLIYTVKSGKKKGKDYDYMTYSFDVNIVVGILIFMVIGIIMIYREIKNIL